MQESILDEIKQRETLKAELIETFEVIKERDTKYILDTVNYHRLKEVSSAEISNVVQITHDFFFLLEHYPFNYKEKRLLLRGFPPIWA